MKRLAWIAILAAAIAYTGSAYADPTAEAACKASGGVWDSASYTCN